MQTPEVVFTAELTRGGKPKNGEPFFTGMPGYTNIAIYAELGNGSRICVASLCVPKLIIENVPNLAILSVHDEDGSWRGNYYVQNYKWMN